MEHEPGGVPALRGARQASLRSTNLALVLHEIYSAGQPLSRALIAAHTGMTRSTVSRLVDDLVQVGLVTELAPVLVHGRGRPSVPLAPGGNEIVALGLEINVARLAARVLDVSGKVIFDEVVPGHFDGSDPRLALARLADVGSRLIARLRPEVHVVGVGLALPGVVDAQARVLRLAPNLGWENLRPGPALADAGLAAVERRFCLGNEADLAAAAVLRPRPGRPARPRSFLYISGEVGIGSAAVVDGRVLSREAGWLGEIGHACVRPDGPLCRCGATGCLEQYAGRHALMRAAQVTSLDEFVAALDRGSVPAVRAVQQAAAALGQVLSSTLNMLDLPTIVIGGTLTRIAPHLVPLVEQELRARVLWAGFRAPAVEIVSRDHTPATTGAAFLALDAVLDDPASYVESRLGTRSPAT